MNPLCSVLKDLRQTHMQIIVYTAKKFQNIIEQTNVEFRHIETLQKEFRIGEMCAVGSSSPLNLLLVGLEKLLDVFDEFATEIVGEIINESPDMVLYDDFALFAKMAVRVFKENKNDLNFLSKLVGTKITGIKRIPKFAAYATTFPVIKGVYPDANELKLVFPDLSLAKKITTGFTVARLSLKAYMLSRKYHIEYKMPLEENTQFDPSNLLLVFSIPELQPKYEFFDKELVKFVGPCIAKTTRLNGDTSNDLNEKLLENEILVNKASGKRLVYASFGTIFNEKIDIFQTLIEAFNSDELQSQNLHVIIATGEIAMKALASMIERKTLKVSANIKLVCFAPQLLILKHAKLFLTHSGFNSIKEAIHFAVPMICMPITVDQPLVAHRIAELKLGIKLDAHCLSHREIVSAIKDIVNNSGYYDRCATYSEMSVKCNGPENFQRELKSYFIKP
jgi:MGT family glycosyltransferase